MLCRAAEGSSIHLEVKDWREAKGEDCNPRLEVATKYMLTHYPPGANVFGVGLLLKKIHKESALTKCDIVYF